MWLIKSCLYVEFGYEDDGKWHHTASYAKNPYEYAKI